MFLSLKPTLTEQDEDDFGELRTIWWNIWSNYGQNAMKFGEDIHEMHITKSPKSFHLLGETIQHLLDGLEWN